jgi:hypothetical protein
MGRFVRGAGPKNENSPSTAELAGFTQEILRVRSTHRQQRSGDALGSKRKTSQNNVSFYRNCKSHLSRGPKFYGFTLVVEGFPCHADRTSSPQQASGGAVFHSDAGQSMNTTGDSSEIDS